LTKGSFLATILLAHE